MLPSLTGVPVTDQVRRHAARGSSWPVAARVPLDEASAREAVDHLESH